MSRNFRMTSRTPRRFSFSGPELSAIDALLAKKKRLLNPQPASASEVHSGPFSVVP
jgi:hypothetical protein